MRLTSMRAGLAAVVSVALFASSASAQEIVDRKVDLNEKVEKKPGPDPIPEVPLGPTLPTHPVCARRPAPAGRWPKPLPCLAIGRGSGSWSSPSSRCG